jgi:hypothetical protein
MLVFVMLVELCAEDAGVSVVVHHAGLYACIWVCGPEAHKTLLYGLIIA